MANSVWLIGCKGMLGTELSILLKNSGHNFIGTDHEVDITDMSALKSFIKNKYISWIINCAAYTAVDKAEDDIENCRRLNTLGAQNIAACAKSIGARMIHISTDYVFDGEKNQPYTEEDIACPTGIYGHTKLDGENIVFQENPLSYIIRTSWLYGLYGNNFVNTMLKLMKEKDIVTVVSDQYGSPTWTFNLSNIIITLIQQDKAGKSIPYGIYHYSNEGVCTWFEFAKLIYENGLSLNLLTKPCNIKSCTSSEYQTKVKRPTYSVLDKTKIKSNIGVEIPDWKYSLKEYMVSIPK